MIMQSNYCNQEFRCPSIIFNQRSALSIISLTLVLSLSLVTISQAQIKEANYAGSKVLKVTLKDAKQVNALRQLAKQTRLDIWNAPGVKHPVDIAVSPKHMPNVQNFFKANNIDWKVMIPDLKQSIGDESSRNGGKQSGGMSWDKWYTYAEISAWLTQLQTAHASTSQLEKIGRRETFENRTIWAFSVTNANRGSNPKGIVIVGGTHAREWISVAVATYIINELTTNAAAYKGLLDQYVLYIVPVANPDGYAYAHEHDRLWTKNRVTSVNTCWGVDIDRNFPYKYASDTQYCNNDYPGEFPAAEIESDAIMKLVKAKNIEQFYGLRAYGQFWIYPYHYDTSVKPANEDQLIRISMQSLIEIKKKHNTEYFQGRAALMTGGLSRGTSLDWAHEDMKIKYAYEIYARDKGTAGYLLPLDQIKPTAEELWAGMVSAANKKEYGGELPVTLPELASQASPLEVSTRSLFILLAFYYSYHCRHPFFRFGFNYEI